MDNINEQNDVIKSFKEFQKKSRKKYKKLVDRIKDEKKYVSTTQYSKDDIEVLGESRTKNQLNVVKNAIRTIINTYRETPYRWNVIDKMTNQPSENLNNAGINFLENPDNATAAIEALESSTSFGLGVLVLTTDYGVDGNPEPVMYSIANLDNVYLDPDITKTNGADAHAAAIVELKSREWVESEYGIDISTIDKPFVDIDEEYDRKEYMPLVTYYKKNKEGVIVYRMIGNEIVEAIPLPLTYIPIIPVFGEKCYEDEKRQSELKAYSLERELTLAQIKHQQEMEKMLLQHRLDGQLTDKDLMEMSAENAKNQMELEKEAISLDREKNKVAMENEVQMVKSAAEFAKAEGNAKVARAKAEQSLAKAKEINAKKENK